MVIEENVKAVAKRTLMTGFGPNTEAEIRENARLDLDKFTITLNTKVVTEKEMIDGKSVDKIVDYAESNLYYIKNENGYYSLDGYDTKITTRPDDLRASAVVTVKINNKFPQNNITLKEMCNLKLGGSVSKRISYSLKDEDTGKWVVHDTITWKKMSDSPDENGNYAIKSHKFNDLVQKFSETRAKELENPERTEEILNSISKGNVEKIKETYGETTIPKYIWVDVQFKTINKSDNNPRVYIPNDMRIDLSVPIEGNIPGDLAPVPVRAEHAKDLGTDSTNLNKVIDSAPKHKLEEKPDKKIGLKKSRLRKNL